MLPRWSETALLVLGLVMQEVTASPTLAQAPFGVADSDTTDFAKAGRGWIDPRPGGGQMLDFTTKTRGEPLNVIISGASDPFVLTDEGFTLYASSIGYAPECMGMHIGNLHLANLGDGNGRKSEELLFRQHYRMPRWGTCWESLAGGQHFRAWKQNGTDGNTGAWFIGASKEEDSTRHHTIVARGYDLGRDWLVEQALAASASDASFWVPYEHLGEQALRALHGNQVEERGWPWPGTGGQRLQWRAEVQWEWGLLEPGRKGVNHGIAIDGRVAVLTIYRVQSDIRPS
ncbi:hypothetical protein MIND_00819800 [Mycena indigotica]|uniref:Secreted protein n=1 Tax=Mycena indigotica TaxID=2126181 RepID=A0A8H6SFR9_9AGAR|nr:uncharacterized protein MIND_00819800 [Mycena indigotica]KAF7298723.1 hypothetical protein MIND_00819800 [Mycena indigotica]